ncbi:enoyl-CoA hydratase/isomerase family protein [Amorphus orientalis]|uniref:3-hydroxyisobutyryl-CoA hydrolase n=1 Tax=Amorphus orientalis TaxID=649198 RepID=A0AAE3VQL7_9HYPH|nr:enoyl-CoA hydratase/isomerase family protein [Amorphus orientalis]MDQ0316060.1 enoyl-CoA hydratase [Amorphus orientalis]
MSEDIRFERHGHSGLVILDRPKALNALSHDMILSLYAKLSEWANDPDLLQVLVTAEGKAFCAGGDIRRIWELGRQDYAAARSFFRDEYRLNALIKRYPKPYVALIDGICMGGGVGLSAHGSHRVASEKLVFAMPETGIGFFPDVGGSFVLSRMPGLTGLHAGLTAGRLDLADSVWAGLVTHPVASEAIPGLVEALLGGAELEPTLTDAVAETGPSALADRQADIDRAYAAESVTDIIAGLEAVSESDWARETAETLRSRSPTSLALAFREIAEAADLSFEECMVMEYRILSRILKGHDFYEGVRALLIDKDGSPDWRPARVEDLDPAAIAAHFDPLDGDDLTLD